MSLETGSFSNGKTNKWKNFSNFVFIHNINGMLARVASHTVKVGEIVCDGKIIPVTGTSYGEVEGLPAPSEGTIYIVSSLVASRCKDRTDVFIPNESVRDDKGRIVGCRSLGRV